MKKVIYALVLSLVVVSGVVFANRGTKTEASPKSFSTSSSNSETTTEVKKWEATPEGIRYKKWEASSAGKKVFAGIEKISKYVREYTNMEAVVTSLSLPAGSRLGFGVMVRIDGDDFILRFDDDPQHLKSLKVNDKILIRSRYVSHAPKYAYPIISAEYAERSGKILYEHAPRKGGC